MLVLTRYVGEKIYMGEEVVITVAGIRGDRVRILTEAPPEVSIHREEVYETIQRGILRRQSTTSPTIAPKEVTRLVLTRCKDDSIFIGNNIRITIVDIRGDRVRIGIDAPQSVAVDREEVRLKKRGGNNPAKKAAA